MKNKRNVVEMRGIKLKGDIPTYGHRPLSIVEVNRLSVVKQTS